MNIQLVNSLVQIIESLTPEEQKLLSQKLAAQLNSPSWEETMAKIQANRRDIHSSRQDKPFDISIEQIIEDMREERTQQTLEACFGR